MVRGRVMLEKALIVAVLSSLLSPVLAVGLFMLVHGH
jgi:hypothetical protein